VLALQGDVREHFVALGQAGAQAVLVRRPAELAGVDGLVLPGGESTTIDKLLRLFGLFDPLRALIRDGLPVFGSCAGMVLLANRIEDGTDDQQCLGGMDITVRRNAFGRQVDSFEIDLDMTGVPGVWPEEASGNKPMRAVFIRAPWVEQAGDGVDVLARIPPTARTGQAIPVSAGKIVAARQGRLLVTAFHPEITGDPRVHQLFVQMIRKP
jgi:5'-phosphate synthase pdxT subunit